jgi:hypothetical protein
VDSCAGRSDERCRPGAENSTGTFGRFRYVASLGLFVLVNSAERDVFVYRADSAH